MPTPIGVNTLTSLVDRHLIEEIVDNVYTSNALLFRLIQGNKKIVQGGTQIEAPIIVSDFNAGGFYQGGEMLTMTPQDTVRNAVWDWKQCYVPLAFEGLTLIKADSPDSIANIITMQANQAQMRMAEVLGTALYGTGGPVTGSDVAGPSGAANSLDGIPAAVDDGSIATTYGGLSRTTYTTWAGNRHDLGGGLSIAELNEAFMLAQQGGRTPSIIVSGRDGYQEYYNYGYAGSGGIVQHNVSVGGADNQLLSAGFHNILFNGTPWIYDDHIAKDLEYPNGNYPIYMLNETFFNLVVTPRADMFMEPFQTPINQDAVAAKLLWAGNLICTSPRTNVAIVDWT